MNVPNSTCVTRTVQSINKYKQKNAGIRRCNQVTSPCLVPLPTAGLVTVNNCRSSGNFSLPTTCDYTVQYSNGTSFQWYYIGLGNPVAFTDNANVSGSHTPILSLNTGNCPPSITPAYIFCIVTNSCGSATSQYASISGCL